MVIDSSSWVWFLWVCFTLWLISTVKISCIDWSLCMHTTISLRFNFTLALGIWSRVAMSCVVNVDTSLTWKSMERMPRDSFRWDLHLPIGSPVQIGNVLTWLVSVDTFLGSSSNENHLSKQVRVSFNQNGDSSSNGERYEYTFGAYLEVWLDA